MEPALAAAGMNAEWTRLFKELTHGLNTGIVVWEGGHPLWRGETDIQTGRESRRTDGSLSRLRRRHRSTRWRRTCRAPLRRWTCHRHRVRGPWACRRQWCGLREPIRLDRDGRESKNCALAGLHGLTVSHARPLHEDLIVEFEREKPTRSESHTFYVGARGGVLPQRLIFHS